MSDSFTDNISLDLDNDRAPCCISLKQGLRKSDQVSINCILNFDQETSFFALYVGHNGAEVAEYASIKFPSLIKNKFYESCEFDKALMKAFLDFDISLLEPFVVDEISSVQKLLHENKVIGDDKEEELNKMDDEEIILTGEMKERLQGIETIKKPNPTDSFLRSSICPSQSSNFTSTCGAENNGAYGSSRSSLFSVVSTYSTEVEGIIENDNNKETEKLIAETSETDHGTSDSNHVDNGEKRKVKEKEKIKKTGKYYGCTAIIALLVKRKLFVANAGDLRCVVSIDGKAHDMSKDHRPLDKFEFERIIAAGGNVSSDGLVNGNLKFSRALGVHDYKKNADFSPLDQMITAFPDVRFLDLKSVNADFIVLACDGVWNTLSSQEVVDFISERINKPSVKLSSICEQLFDKCLDLQAFFKDSNDNMVCIIVTVKPKHNRTFFVEMEKSNVV